MEVSRNQSKSNSKQNHRNVKALGSPPELTGFFDKEHTEAGQRANEIWMATLGIAIAKNGFVYGKDIWKMLSGSFEHLPAVMADFRRREQLAGESLIGDVTIEELQEISRYIPAVFAKA